MSEALLPPIDDQLSAAIARATLHQPVYGGRGARDWRRGIFDEIDRDCTILDVGKSSRDMHGELRERAGRVETLDLNRFEDYPDLLLDLCGPIPGDLHGRYDAVVCRSVLEALHDPQAGIDNLHAMLKPGGRLFLFAPFLGKYEAPPDGRYHDLFRFTRDGLAWLLRDFSAVDIYPVRGQYSAIANLLPHWKLWVEAHLGHRLNRVLDRLAEPGMNALNSSGYYVRAVKWQAST